jgi:hypothetical protein
MFSDNTMLSNTCFPDNMILSDDAAYILYIC